MLRLIPFLFASFISSCALITTPVKVVGKAATTGIGLAGKAAGAGINAMTPRTDEEEAE